MSVKKISKHAARVPARISRTHSCDRAWDRSNSLCTSRGRLDSRYADDLDKAVTADRDWVLLSTTFRRDHKWTSSAVELGSNFVRGASDAFGRRTFAYGSNGIARGCKLRRQWSEAGRGRNSHGRRRGNDISQSSNLRGNERCCGRFCLSVRDSFCSCVRHLSPLVWLKLIC
jgi:hypothetical protein